MFNILHCKTKSSPVISAVISNIFRRNVKYFHGVYQLHPSSFSHFDLGFKIIIGFFGKQEQANKNIISFKSNILQLHPLPPWSPSQPPRSPSPERRDPPWPRRTLPPPCPPRRTSGRRPSWRTSGRTCGPA